MKVTTIKRGGRSDERINRNGFNSSFGFVAYEKLTYVVDVVKHLIA